MATSDQDKEEPPLEDQVEKIKKEEIEDPTSYYAQGDSKDSFNEEVEFSKPVSPVEKNREEMSLLKAIAYLAFGLAALAIVFILFFIRDLDSRVGGVGSAVSSLEEKIAPIKKEVTDSLERVNADINELKIKINNSESRLAVMELKRALVAIQSMELSDSPGVKDKSNQVVTSIESLLGEFGGIESNVPAPAGKIQAGEVIIEEAPAIELPVVEPVSEEHAPASGDQAEQEPVDETISESKPTSEMEDIVEEPVDVVEEGQGEDDEEVAGDGEEDEENGDEDGEEENGDEDGEEENE